MRMVGRIAKGFGVTGLLVLAAGAAVAAATAPGDAASGFEKIKSLAGEWEGKGPDGAPFTITYTVVSKGSAVVERLSVGDMVTVYHRDGDSLLLTHYCAGGNQPRMRAEASKDGGKSFDFRFVDVTNLADQKASHMRHMTLSFKDADHISERWVHLIDGKESPMTFELARKK